MRPGTLLKAPGLQLIRQKGYWYSMRQKQRILRRSAPVKFYMTIKALEIRDEGTFIAVLAIQMLPDNPVALYYFNRCGYPLDGSSIMLMVMANGRATNDPYEWEGLGFGRRTMPTAHNYIIGHFHELSDGDVVNVAFWLGNHSTGKCPREFPLSFRLLALFK
jgi:hypothetical protein